MKNIFLFLSAVLSCTLAEAQEFLLHKTELTPEQVILHYDLSDTTKGRTYSIFVYTSIDNFLTPLTRLSGDVGIEVKPGPNHKIIWNAKEELGNSFNGDVELEVRGRVYVPFIKFEGFKDVEIRKRGVPFLVKWSGGTRQNILNFQLYRDKKLVYTFPNIPNTYEYKLTIPKSVKTGKDYYLKISDTKNSDQVVLTTSFELRPKIPLAMKILPIVIVGGLVYLLLPEETTTNKIDGPPEAPTSKN